MISVETMAVFYELYQVWFGQVWNDMKKDPPHQDSVNRETCHATRSHKMGKTLKASDVQEEALVPLDEEEETPQTPCILDGLATFVAVGFGYSPES